MAYAKLVTVGHYKVCRHIDTGCLYVAGYDPETRKSFYRSLRTNDLESAVVATRSLVDRHVTGDPKAFLNLKPIRAVRELLEWHRTYVATLASAEAENIHIDRMIRMIGDLSLRAAVRSDFEAFRDRCLADEEIALSSVSRNLTTLRSAIGRAIDDKLISRDAAPSVPEFMTKNHKRSAPPKGRPMKPDEIAAQIDRIEFPHLLIGEIFLLNTAARIGAVLDLEPLQIDHQYGLINLNPAGRLQTTKWRPTLPLTDTLRPWTENLPPGHIVQWRGEPVGEIDTGFAAACRAANLPGRENTYSIRHAIGRFMQAERVPAEEIAVWFGHIQPPTSIETTLIYSPYSPDFLVNAKRAAEKFVRLVDSFCQRDLLRPFWR